MNVVLGQVVYSKAGRDEGKIFLVTKIVDANYVYISDGDLRRLENPKKKKVKHLVVTKVIMDNIAQKLSAEFKLTNAEIRKALADLREDAADNK